MRMIGHYFTEMECSLHSAEPFERALCSETSVVTEAGEPFIHRV